MYKAVLHFWFDEIEPKQWWVKDSDFDQVIKQRFGDLHAAASQGTLYPWRESAEGRLAEIIVLDQFSRNIYRDTPLAFTYDTVAVVLAQEALRVEADQQLNATQCSFLYMPFMHSESKLLHELAVTLFEKNGVQSNLDFELKHKVIIDRFGRYPHRNAILGRQSSEDEIAFLQQPGSHF